MSEINDCPACGTSLNCSGCGEDIQNIVEQSALLKEKDAEIKRLRIALQDVADWNGSCGCDSCVGCFAAGVLEGKDEP